MLMNPNQPSQLIDFERADVMSPIIYPPEPRPVASGKKPHPMTVEPVPRTYLQRPRILGDEVVGRTDGGRSTPAPAMTNIPYMMELDLTGCVRHSGRGGR
jgi:hypothetical protein